MPKVVLQKVWISASVPGSWPMNWLQGTPSTTRPWSLYSEYSFSSPSYCGVSPHFDAVFTTSTTLSLKVVIGSGWPSIDWKAKS